MSNGGVLLILGELCRETILRRTFILKKLISSMAFLMTLLVATICSAESVSDSEVSLGGIPYQASSDYVQSIYGRPSSSSTTYDHPLFPGRVTTWKYGDDVPEWLSDIAKVASIDNNTHRISLETRETNTGGFEILDSSGQHVLARLDSKTDILCRDISSEVKGITLFSMTPRQFDLIYVSYGQL